MQSRLSDVQLSSAFCFRIRPEELATMVFTSPSKVPKLPFDPPSSIPICDFMLDERYGRRALKDSRPPFVCGLTGVEYSAVEVKDRVDKLARALSKALGWQPNGGTEWDKVAGIFSVNTVGSAII